MFRIGNPNLDLHLPLLLGLGGRSDVLLGEAFCWGGISEFCVLENISPLGGLWRDLFSAEFCHHQRPNFDRWKRRTSTGGNDRIVFFW